MQKDVLTPHLNECKTYYRGAKMRRIKRKKQKKIIIISTLSLLLFLCIGYAAFSTNLTLIAKGNIKYKTIDSLKNQVITNGDGLYKDNYETGRFIYKGLNPNNYIKIDEEIYRIISIENNNSLKVVKDESIGKFSWDTINNRDSSTSTYCTNANRLGCNAWAANSNLVGSPNTFTVYAPYNDKNRATATYTGTVTKDASLNTYLNTSYYNSLSSFTKKIIKSTIWNINSPGHESEDDDDISLDIIQEKGYQWEGNIGLFSILDAMKSTTNTSCTSLKVALNNWSKSICAENNWLVPANETVWTISAGVRDHRGHVWTVSGIYEYFNCNDAKNARDVRPTFYLIPNIGLTGDGSKTNPYNPFII